MRILIVSEDIPSPSMGGLARHALTLARALRRAGHDVELLGNSEHALETMSPEDRFEGRFYGELNGQDIGWKEARLGMYLPPRRSWVARRFARIILRHAGRYDVVHYHGHVPNLARHIPQHINFVQTRHDQGSECLLNTRFRDGQICETTDPAACAACRKAQPNTIQTAVSGAAVRRYRQEVAESFRRHKTIFVSDMVRRNFARAAGPGPWGVTVHNFVDLEGVAQARRQARVSSDGQRRIFLAAKLYPAKGIEPFLRLLAPRLPADMQVTIAGDGSDLGRLSAAFGGARIHFLGWCGMRDTLAHAARADAIVVPSVWEEPCGTTILEALLLGKTTFALERGGTPELKIYAAGPQQLRLYPDLPPLIDGLLAFQPGADYPAPPAGLGGVERAAERLLQIYRLPPGPLPAADAISEARPVLFQPQKKKA